MTGTRINPLLVILGATASGKSAVAHELAHRSGGEILCVDSMTVYRGMNIGTAKPTEQEQREVPYHLLDVVEPDDSFTVARFVELADSVIADAARRGVPLIATGGTPLYYKALFQGLFDGPPADAPLRARLIAQGNAAMHARVTEVDPPAAERIHINDTKRLVRALEVYELTGRPISSFQQEWTTGQLRHPATFIGLNWEKELLNRRINARVKSMIEAGWIDEVRGLLARFGRLSKTACEATGYAELIDCIQHGGELDAAIEKIKIATRQLARKQLKWFRRFEGVRWINGDRPVSVIAAELEY